MLQNYIRIAYRNLLKNPVFTYINIFGLAVGMAAFLFIVQYIRFERSYEDVHANAENIQRISLEIYNGSELVATDCETYAPLGPLVKERFPEVVEFARFYGVDGLRNVRAGSTTFLEEGFYFADAAALKIFTYKVLNGNPEQSLTAPFEVVLTKTLATKYFGRTDVAGESIEIDDHLYKVKSVIEDVPANTHLKFTALLSRLSLATLKPWYPDDKWYNNNEYTYVLTVPGTDLANFNDKLAKLSASLKEELGDERAVAEGIEGIHLYSTKSYEPEPAGNARIVNYFTFIAIFVIVIAWINYINLSTARAVERAREVGIRKVMGSVRRQLVSQFLIEAVMLNVLAGTLSFVLLQTTFPFLRDLTGAPLTLNVMADPAFWYLALGLVVSGSFLSGMYPAFVLSSFNPAGVLKGKFRASSHGQLLRKGLVTFQFSATVVLIIAMCTVYLQVTFLKNLDLGMDLDQALVLSSQQINTSDSSFATADGALKAELLRNPAIERIAKSESLPGVNIQEISTVSLNRLGENSGHDNFEYSCFSADADFIPTLGMTLVAGENFSDGAQHKDQIIVNEEAALRLGFFNAEEAVGARVTFRQRPGSDGSTIIGVLKNFYHRSPKEAHVPMFIYPRETANYYSLKLNTTDIHQTIASVKSTWEKVFPNKGFNYFFLDDKYDQQYRADTQFGQVMTAFSLLTIFIACLGLFGLSSYTITQRTKEIGIRKILGASVSNIVSLLSADFAKTIALAAMIALPVAWLAMNEWLSGYSVRVDLSPWVFVFAVGIIILLAFVTVSVQTIKTAMENPVASLNHE